jgi:O-acetylserine/cysteine efflux transporter
MARTRAATAVTALFVAAAFWGCATTGTKYALGGFGAITLLAVELVGATLALWIAAVARGTGTPPSWRLAITLGLLEPATAYLGDTAGLARTSAANAAVLLGLESCFVVLLAAVFLRERIDRALGLAVVAGFAGLGLLERTGLLSGPGIGDTFVLGGTFSAAVYVIVARKMDASIDPLALTVRQFAVASAAIVPIAVCSWLTGSETVPTHVPLRFWAVALLVGIGGYGASFLLYNYAIVIIEAGPAAVIINMIPAFGLATAVLLLGERLAPNQIAGAALLTASVIGFSWTLRSKQRALEPPLAPRPEWDLVKEDAWQHR